MKLSEMITQLEDAKRHHGDLPIFTWDGSVSEVRVRPSANGLMPGVRSAKREPNELVIEFSTD